MSAVVLAGAEPKLRDLVQNALEGHSEVVVEEDPNAGVREEHGDVDLLVLGESAEDPIRIAQRVQARQSVTSILIVVAPETAADTARALRFSPLLSGDVHWVRADRPEEIGEQVRMMALKSRRRRRFSTALGRLREKVPPHPSDEERTLYLDTLLDYAPIGVVILDEAGSVIDLNPEARRFLTSTDTSARGRRVLELLPPPTHERSKELLQEASTVEGGSASARLPWSLSDSEMHVELTAARLSRDGDAAGMMLIFRDVTADVNVARTKWELREQQAVARALEEQADELRHLNEELEARNEELQEFAYVASHDLQEPLRKIASFSDLLMSDAAERLNEQDRFYIQRMQAASLRMSELIRGLLRFSRVRTEEQNVRPVDLNQVLNHVQSDLVIPIREADAEIRADELPVVEGDEGQLRQLFQNLISNSIKFRKSGERPRIHVAADPAAATDEYGRTMYRITVSDNGIGLDDKYADRIFSPFQRLQSSEDYPGTGMGLAICARIVERHGGRIDVRSRPGEGATFIIDLPS